MISLMMPQKDFSYRDEILELEQNEEILQDNPSRWVILPIKFPEVWNMFKKHEMSFWTAEDIQYNDDLPHLTNSSVGVANSMKMLIASCAVSDASLQYCVRSCDLLDHIQIPEARAFFSFQCAFENIHEEVNCHLLVKYLSEEDKREEFCKSVIELSSVQEKRKFFKEIQSNSLKTPFVEKLMFLLISKRLFSSVIRLMNFWSLKMKTFPAFCMARKRIGNDEELQSQFCILLFDSLKNRLPLRVVNECITECTNVEKIYADEILNYNALNLKREEVHKYIEAVADSIFVSLSLPKLFDAMNPFSWAPVKIEIYEEDYKETMNAAKDGLNSSISDKNMMDMNLADESMKFSLDEDF